MKHFIHVVVSSLGLVLLLSASSCAINPYAESRSDDFKRERRRALVADIHADCPSIERTKGQERELRNGKKR